MIGYQSFLILVSEIEICLSISIYTECGRGGLSLKIIIKSIVYFIIEGVLESKKCGIKIETKKVLYIIG